MDDLRLVLKWLPQTGQIRLVCDVRSDDNCWHQLIDESLPSSSVASRVHSLCALAVAVANEEQGKPSTVAT